MPTSAQGGTEKGAEDRTDQTVLDWELGVEGAAGCLWGCWRAEGGAWNPSDERTTVEHTCPAEDLVVLQPGQDIGVLGDTALAGALLNSAPVHPGA